VHFDFATILIQNTQQAIAIMGKAKNKKPAQGGLFET
jgi:hypothetical protein